MFVNKIKLKDFRNYREMEIDLCRGLNIIYGKNAQGKTNILESIFLCVSGRSHRTSKDLELIKFNENEYEININVQKNKENIEINIKYSKDGKKKIKINDVSIEKIGNLIGRINAVMFSPEDLMIIKDGPSERRRYIDISISQTKPTYFYDLQQYQRILKQRNALLKEINRNNRNNSLINTLDIWNEKLIKSGSRIINERRKYLTILECKAKEIHLRNTNDKEKIKIEYKSSFKINDNDEIEEIEDKFLSCIKQNKLSEIAKSSTLYGPHRDDIDISINELKTKTFGSQGQQRTIVLSLKIAELAIIRDLTNDIPILLLDDVMSELDDERKEYILNNLNGIQTIITCTENNYFNNITKEFRFYKVVDGKIQMSF